mmetsp:Transcript_15920/g.29943  ORF Transcript_15920/g.29943 Transcript_15920/m.29943 type:complete len:609 (+) Transcript_15920:150-1976(+)
MSFSVGRSRKLSLLDVLLISFAFLVPAGHQRPEALPHCLLQRSQQTLRRADKHAPDPVGASWNSASLLHKAEDAMQTPALLQAQSNTYLSQQNTKLMLDPSFFGSFTDAESTFDADGQDKIEEVANPETVSVSDDILPTVAPEVWFHETASGGAKEAWQTFDQASEDASFRGTAPGWQRKDFGRYEQDWAPEESREKGNSGRLDGKEATWFDVEVDQYDVFGRPRAPSPRSSRFYVEWSKVSRTAEWSCGPPGCVANASLKVFENVTEMEYKMCQLSVLVHATDFDDQYGREKIEWIVVNGKEAVRDVLPRAPKGCQKSDNVTELRGSNVTVQKVLNTSLLAMQNASHAQKAHLQKDETGDVQDGLATQKDSKEDSASNSSTSAGEQAKTAKSSLPLYPCLRDLPLEGLITGDGMLTVSGKISPAVDECPVNGNHLSGILAVSCFARPIVTLPPLTTTEEETTTTTTTTTVEFKTSDTKHFGCEVPGCTASAVLAVDDFNLTTRKCTLTVRINETDYDEKDGTSEVLEWIKVNENTTSGNLKPGQNPCLEAESPTDRNYVNFTVLDKKDVTTAIKDGVLRVSLKITDMVDECAVEGRLLDGQADLSCS